MFIIKKWKIGLCKNLELYKENEKTNYKMVENISDKGLVSEIQKELTKLNSKKVNIYKIPSIIAVLGKCKLNQ